ncbi:hypothetical protein [Paraclostridium bifermentans]|jgi:outer membrane protein assembly factor BamE (lipoprotein component of BamABCDE complex)|uniref:hypothetical protein n=1 Tax=Paraclostridium bifermentans TaxID=1490 RepID=UPI001898EFD2|nr:hypothetical protein [Paraclostridium bifermentans]MBS5953285.1 hypothetical protein [Paraclostridium bifermentans]MBU5288523.1 hypothetical protein [Paraclostridium bifermentans]
MKKSLLISIMLIVILMFSGCSMKSGKKVDKATQQKNITKIQNDVSEVMGKNYEYVMDTMGDPYMTTYYINTEKYGEFEHLDKEGILKNLNIEMVYPKEGYESSALYVDISKDKVVDVESDEFVGLSSGFEDLPEKAKSANIIVDFYNDQAFIDSSKVDLKSIKSYIGKNIEELVRDTSLDMPNAVAYSKNKEKIINYYILQSKNNNTVFVVSVTEDKGKILDITQVSDASLIKELINMSN